LIDVSEFDAVLVVSFGGPEGPDDVVPFLENVTRGRGIPKERLAEVGAHYDHFGGISPINEQCRRIVVALQAELDGAGHDLAVYWGNRNWDPYLSDTLAAIAADGHQRVLALVTSAYSSYSGCRQYRVDIAAALATLGDRAPDVVKVRQFFNHPGFVEPFRDAVADALGELGSAYRPDAIALAFTAHSIPIASAATCDYEQQLRDVAGLVSEGCTVGRTDLVFQSRSGPPQVPWLEPDIGDHIEQLASDGYRACVIVPIGFVSDHMEVVWDLDHQAAEIADEVGIELRRVSTPGTAPDPRFITMWRSLIEEQIADEVPVALGSFGPRPVPCAADCCPAPSRPTGRAS
jgi:ferrochelatase